MRKLIPNNNNLIIINQREAKIHNIRQELKALRHQYKQAGEEERIGLVQLTCILRKKILVLRRAEWHRRRHVKEPVSGLHS